MAKSPSVDIIAATEKIMDFIADRRDLSEECTYITISHLYQYALPVAIQNNYRGCEFILKTQILYRKYMEQILKCKAMPWKEKVIFYLYAHGYVYTNKFIKKYKGERENYEQNIYVCSWGKWKSWMRGNCTFYIKNFK